MLTTLKKLSIIAMILGLAVGFGTVAQAATLIVNNLADEDSDFVDCRTLEGSYATIQSALNAANTYDFVKVCPGTGTYDGINLDFNGKTLNLEAFSSDFDDTIIHGNGSKNVFGFNSPSEGGVVKGFTIENGKGSYGGGMMISGTTAEVTIENCKFNGNIGVSGAGAIYAGFKTNVNILDSDFIGNTDGYPPNHSIGSGGAIYVLNDGSAGRVVIENCKFRENKTQHGGAICVAGTFLPDPEMEIVTIRNCIFDSNEAWTNGGAIRCHFTSPLIENCVFANNKVTRTDINQRRGGAIATYGWASPTIMNCLFSGNEAIGGGGGAIFFWDYSGPYLGQEANPYVLNCTIYGNSIGEGGYWGGSIAIDLNGLENSSAVKVANCIIQGNVPDDTIWTPDNKYFHLMEINNYDSSSPVFVGNPPEFIYPDDISDFQLSSGAPCVDAGILEPDFSPFPPAPSPLPDFDLAGNPRIIDADGLGAPDLDQGALELQ